MVSRSHRGRKLRGAGACVERERVLSSVGSVFSPEGTCCVACASCQWRCLGKEGRAAEGGFSGRLSGACLGRVFHGCCTLEGLG